MEVFLWSDICLSVFCLVYGQLRERESDTFFVECVVYDFIHVKIHIPVVFGLGPHTYLNIYTAGRQSSQSDKWSWSREDSFIGRNDSLQYSFYFLIILSVLYSEYPFSAAHVLFAVVGDGIAAQCTVWYINNSVVYRCRSPPPFDLPVNHL